MNMNEVTKLKQKALPYLWYSSRTHGILIPIILLCQLPCCIILLCMLPCCCLFCLALPSIFGDSSLQSVILPLQRECHFLSALRNCLPAPNLKIMRVLRGDCAQSSQRWQAWTVVRAYCWKWEPTNDLATVTTPLPKLMLAHFLYFYTFLCKNDLLKSF